MAAMLAATEKRILLVVKLMKKILSNAKRNGRDELKYYGIENRGAVKSDWRIRHKHVRNE